MKTEVRSGDRCVMALNIREIHGVPILEAAVIVDYIVDYITNPPDPSEAVHLQALGEFAEAVRQHKAADGNECRQCAGRVWGNA
jgi:hypothetical protein